MTRSFLVGVTVAALALHAAPVLSHHSVAAEFDRDNQGELEGEITRVWFTNPHVRYQLTVTNDDGSTEDWELQGGNVTNLRAQGWLENSIVVGDRVTVNGSLGRRGAKKLEIRRLVTAAGVQVPPARDPDAAPPAGGR